MISLYNAANNNKANEPANSRSRRGRHRPCTACNDLLTCRAIPDANRLAFHSVLKKTKSNESNTSVKFPPSHGESNMMMRERFFFACLAAKGAGVPCVLRNFHLEGNGTKISPFLV
jgi:hypothetical protein